MPICKECNEECGEVTVPEGMCPECFETYEQEQQKQTFPLLPPDCTIEPGREQVLIGEMFDRNSRYFHLGKWHDVNPLSGGGYVTDYRQIFSRAKEHHP